MACEVRRIENLPFRVTESGKYILCVSSLGALTIKSQLDHVEIDLNGNTLRHLVVGKKVKRVSVINGSIADFGFPARPWLLDDNTQVATWSHQNIESGVGLWVKPGCRSFTLENVDLSRGWVGVVLLNCDNATLRGNRFRDFGGSFLQGTCPWVVGGGVVALGGYNLQLIQNSFQTLTSQFGVWVRDVINGTISKNQMTSCSAVLFDPLQQSGLQWLRYPVDISAYPEWNAKFDLSSPECSGNTDSFWQGNVASVNLRRCGAFEISDNQIVGGGPVILNEACFNCQVLRNSITSTHGAGLWVRDTGYHVLRSNVITGIGYNKYLDHRSNRRFGYHGILLQEAPNVTVESNVIQGVVPLVRLSLCSSPEEGGDAQKAQSQMIEHISRRSSSGGITLRGKSNNAQLISNQVSHALVGFRLEQPEASWPVTLKDNRSQENFVMGFASPDQWQAFRSASPDSQERQAVLDSLIKVGVGFLEISSSHSPPLNTYVSNISTGDVIPFWSPTRIPNVTNGMSCPNSSCSWANLYFSPQ